MSEIQLAPDELAISVIIPFVQGRGQELAAIKSWTQGQTLAPEKFEVIVVTDGAQPNLECRVKELLRRHDTFTRHSLPKRSALYDCGARLACGKLLLLTELHCLAAPDCLAEAVHFFGTHNHVAAARCRNVGISATPVAQMEEWVYDETYRLRSAPDHWYRVALRGFVIYRQLYLELGGLEPELGLFAEPVLAVQLHQQGCQVGEARHAVVHHYNSPDLSSLLLDVKDYTYGECVYRLKHPVFSESYFGHTSEWANRLAYYPPAARRLSWTITKGVLATVQSGAAPDILLAQLQAWQEYAPSALLGVRWPLFKAWLALASAWLRLQFWRFHSERGYQAYRDYWTRAAPYSRLDFINHHIASLDSSTWPETDQYDLAQTEAERLVGFYAVETWQEQTFRWSGPVALVQLSLPQGAYEAQLQLLPIRPPQPPLHLQFFFNGCRVSSFSHDATGEVISFRLDSAMCAPGLKQQLVLMCNPLKPEKLGSTDLRQLGLAVKGIYFRPIK